MPHIFESMIVDAPAAVVWEEVRDFGGMGRWYPALAECGIEGGGPSGPMAVRRLEFPGGAYVRERLEAVSEVDMSISYSMVESNIPSAIALVDYLGSVRVQPVTDDGRSFVAWTGRFDLKAGVNLQGAAAGMAGAYRDMLQALAAAHA